MCCCWPEQPLNVTSTKRKTQFKCMQHLQDFHCFILLSDSTFRFGAEAIILLSWKPPDSFNKNSDSPSRESELLVCSCLDWQVCVIV